MVSTLKFKAGGTRRKRSVSEGISIDTLLKAKLMAEKLGGIDEARAALAALARLQLLNRETWGL